MPGPAVIINCGSGKMIGFCSVCSPSCCRCASLASNLSTFVVSSRITCERMPRENIWIDCKVRVTDRRDTYLNHVWHRKVHDFVSPCQFENNVGSEEVVALKSDWNQKWIKLFNIVTCKRGGKLNLLGIGRRRSNRMPFVPGTRPIVLQRFLVCPIQLHIPLRPWRGDLSCTIRRFASSDCCLSDEVKWKMVSFAKTVRRWHYLPLYK